MGLSRQDWMDVAEKSAAEHYGRKHAGWFLFKRFGATPTAALIGAGALGWVAYQAWSILSAMFAGTNSASGIPVGLWVAAGVLLVLTVVAYRPGRMPTRFTPVLLKAVGFTLAWLALIAYAIGALA